MCVDCFPVCNCEYLQAARYPHPHHSQLIPSSSKSHSPHKPTLRAIKRMPSRAFPPPSPSRLTPQPSEDDPQQSEGYGIRHDGVDWKQMFKVGVNWANGNASLQSLPHAHTASSRGTTAEHPYSPHLIALAPSFIFTAHTSSPLLHVYPSPSAGGALGVIPPPPGWSTPKKPDDISCVCVDQALAPVETGVEADYGAIPARVAVFYKSGGFVIVSVHLSNSKLSWRRMAVRQPAQRRQVINDPVVLAQYHHPVVLSCTFDFRVTVHALDKTSNTPVQLQSLQSQVSFHPATLSLLPLDPTTPPTDVLHFHGALTYSTPLYPRSWTIAVQELFVDLNPTSMQHLVRRGECWHVGRSATRTLQQGSRGWPRRAGHSVPGPIIGVRGDRAVGVGTDGRWCVLAGQDNQIQVYALPPPGATTAPIVHSQTLLAHSAAVTSISLSAGRCVSGGRDGRVLVWELDADDGEEFKFVEVRQGGRAPRRRSEQGIEDEEEAEKQDSTFQELPHPRSISTAARQLFLSKPPTLPPTDRPNPYDTTDVRQPPPIIKQLAFDEQKIVGLVLDSVKTGLEGVERDEVMRVWSFSN